MRKGDLLIIVLMILAVADVIVYVLSVIDPVHHRATLLEAPVALALILLAIRRRLR